MSAGLLAEEWQRIFAADPAFDGLAKLTELDTEFLTLPALEFNVAVTPLDGIGRVLSYALDLIVHTHSSEPAVAPATPESLHDARVSSLRNKLFGATAAGRDAAKAAITAAMLAGGKFSLRNYDAPPEDIDPASAQMRFSTAVHIRGVAILL